MDGLIQRSIDDVLVKEDGYENLTTAPKQFDELERIIDGEGF